MVSQVGMCLRGVKEAFKKLSAMDKRLLTRSSMRNVRLCNLRDLIEIDVLGAAKRALRYIRNGSVRRWVSRRLRDQLT